MPSVFEHRGPSEARVRHGWVYYENENPPFYETWCGVPTLDPEQEEGPITCLMCLTVR
jgi:hypothetical protein